MGDVIDIGIGLVCGGGVGYVLGLLKTQPEIRQYRDDIFVRDQLLDAAQRKLKVLTERDARGRFTGGK